MRGYNERTAKPIDLFYDFMAERIKDRVAAERDIPRERIMVRLSPSGATELIEVFKDDVEAVTE